jgi:hypothetical protein
LLSALPDGGGVTAIVGERSFVTGAAFCVLKTFLVNVHDGSFDEGVKVVGEASSPFPPLPPAAHRVALASHPTQIRVAAAAAAVSLIGGDARVDNFVSPLVKTSDAPPFTAFFASGDDAFGGATREEGLKNHALDSCALRDRVEAEHVSTLAAASAQPPPRRARVFYLGDESSVWSVAFAEGPKASRRCRLPPPPSSAERAVPVRLRVAVTAGAPSGTATGERRGDDRRRQYREKKNCVVPDSRALPDALARSKRKEMRVGCRGGRRDWCCFSADPLARRDVRFRDRDERQKRFVRHAGFSGR